MSGTSRRGDKGWILEKVGRRDRLPLVLRNNQAASLFEALEMSTLLGRTCLCRWRNRFVYQGLFPH
jgi:hypothetical protein